MTTPLAIEGVPLGGSGREGGGRRDAAPLTLAVPAHEAVALLGDEESGLGRLGGYALGLERPPAGRVTGFGTIIADLPERERLAYRRGGGKLPARGGVPPESSLPEHRPPPVGVRGRA